MYSDALYVLILAGLAQLTGWLALFTFRRPQRAGTSTLGSLLLANTLWSFAGVCEYLTHIPALRVLASQTGYVGFTAIGPVWLALAMYTTGRGHLLTRRNQILLAAPAVITALLGLTNPLHHLIWALPVPSLDLVPPPGLGPWGSIYALVTSAFLLVGAYLYVVTFARSAQSYRRPFGLMVAASLVPLAANAVTLAGVLPNMPLDLSQISLPVAAALVYLGFSRLNEQDLAPVAARVVIDNLREAVVVLDAAGRLADLNAAARRLFRLGDEAMGKPAMSVLQPAEVWQQVADAAEAETEVAIMEGERERRYHLTISPLRDGRDRLVGRVALLHDVSHERALLKMRDDLTHMLIHDLRNPFSAIYSALQLIDTLLREEPARADSDSNEAQLPRAAAVQGAIDIALHSSARAQEMLDSLLDLNRLESGQMPVTPERLDVGQLAREILQDLQPSAASRGLKLEADIPDGLPDGLADPDLVDRVLRNLVGNALKFTPNGGRVTVRARPGQGDWLLISVSDTGPGISAQVRQKLFQKFVRGPGAAQGSGLGLAFCKLAVEAMGGRIWAESEGVPGQGATFQFTLPQSPAASLETPPLEG